MDFCYEKQKIKNYFLLNYTNHIIFMLNLKKMKLVINSRLEIYNFYVIRFICTVYVDFSILVKITVVSPQTHSGSNRVLFTVVVSGWPDCSVEAWQIPKLCNKIDKWQEVSQMIFYPYKSEETLLLRMYCTGIFMVVARESFMIWFRLYWHARLSLEDSTIHNGSAFLQ